jgi:hypothetical protein
MSFMEGGGGVQMAASGGDQTALMRHLIGLGKENVEKIGAWVEKNPKQAEMLLNTGGGLLASLVSQRNTEQQIKAAKEIRATENQYKKDAEEREMRRAAHAAVKRESWGSGTGILDAAMQQKGAR